MNLGSSCTSISVTLHPSSLGSYTPRHGTACSHAPAPCASCASLVDLCPPSRLCPAPGQVFLASLMPSRLFGSRSAPDPILTAQAPQNSLGLAISWQDVALSATYNVAALVNILLRFGITSKKFVDNLLGWTNLPICVVHCKGCTQPFFFFCSKILLGTRRQAAASPRP